MCDIIVYQWPGNLLADSPDTARSCSRHGLVAARLTSERPGSVTPLYYTGSAFIAALTVDVCETDRRRLAALAQ